MQWRRAKSGPWERTEEDPMLSSIVTFAAAEAEHTAPSPFLFGAIALIALLALLLVAFAFRSVGTRHR